MDQVRSTGSDVAFARSLLDLLEVTAQISQLDELVADACSVGETESPETRTWKDISSMSAQFARGSLRDRQVAAIDELFDMSARGGSLMKEAPGQIGQQVEHKKFPASLPQSMVNAPAGKSI